MNEKKEANKFIQTLNAKDHGKHVFAGCDDCTRCCDGGLYTCANVLLDEMFDTAKLFPVVFSRTGDNINLTLLYTLKKGIPCPYLDMETQNCSVYDSVRPRACKIYPFNIKEVAAPQADTVSYAVVFDSRCPGVRVDAEGIPLIGENGKLSDTVTSQFIGDDMLRRYKQNLLNTQTFLKLVKEYDLLVEQSYAIGPRGDTAWYYGDRPNTLKFWKISEERLNDLSSEAVMKFHEHHFFNAIYTHLNSLGNLSKLIQVKNAWEQQKQPVDLFTFRV